MVWLQLFDKGRFDTKYHKTSFLCLGRAMLEGEGWEARGTSTPRSRLDGTLAFLQNQFQELMEDKVGRLQ